MYSELLDIMDEMVSIIEKLCDLPKECPEIKNSETYIQMIDRAKILEEYMMKRTEEMNDFSDKAELMISMNGFGNINNNN